MKSSLASLLTGAVVLGAATMASAHFQMIYTPEMALKQGGQIPLKMVFTHPFDAGYTMDMGTPEEFFVIRTRGENEPVRTDLKEGLKAIEWASLTNTGKAWETTYQARGGDHIFCLIPEPYWEAKEDAYIKQNTKVIVNVGGEPGAWHEPVGLPTEIVPLAKPYDRWTGNVFQGQVLLNGEPVPNAEIEVEYLNHQPLLDSNSFAEEPAVTVPQESFSVQTIFADNNGVFTFGIPRAGWWGFAALDLEEDYTYKDHPCSHDAVIWIQAKDIN